MKIGIRKEDKGKWEKRAPLAPFHVSGLLENGIEVLVQRSEVRVFKDEEYAAAGATLVDSVDDCDIILGVKEIPIEKFRPEKTYIFFSHTIKGQTHNMPSLKKLMDLGCNLLDYERIVDKEGKRLVFFGPFAGKAGMIDGLWGLGQKWNLTGLKTPFAEIKQTVHYHDFKDVKQSFAKIAAEISEHGFPPETGPVVIGFAGYGNVSLGAQEVIDFLPVTPIGPAELLKDDFYKDYNPKTIYKVVFTLSDMYHYPDGSAFDKFTFFKRPEDFKSDFQNYWRRLTMLVNAIYWSEKADRIIRRKDLSEDTGRLSFIADISCDIEGGVEVTTKATTIDKPFLTYLPKEDTVIDGISAAGVPVLAVDNLPCELSRDATIYFGNSLFPLLKKIPGRNPDDFSQWPEEFKPSVILEKGKLTPKYEYLKNFI